MYLYMYILYIYIPYFADYLNGDIPAGKHISD